MEEEVMSTAQCPGRAVIVGAGVGGLAAAIALHQHGWRVVVLERAPSLAPVGSGISLFPNALRALDAIGLGARVAQLGRTELGLGIREPSGRWLSRLDSDAIARRHGPTFLLQRADLINLLRQALPADVLLTDMNVTGEDVRMGGSGLVTVEHGGGSFQAEVLIAADGVHSGLRRSLFPTHPRPSYAGYTTWRLVVALDPGPRRGVSAETWGSGQRFGLARLRDSWTYCYASATTDARRWSGDATRELAELRWRFDDWHDPIPDLLAAATPDTVVRTDVYEQRTPLPTYVTGRAVLLGDAAHAMAPDLGQGGGQALEDAVTLAAALTSTPSVSAALAQYDLVRRSRTQRIVRAAHRVGAAAHLRNRLAVAGRNALLRAIPPGISSRSLDRILRWVPPAHPSDTEGTDVR